MFADDALNFRSYFDANVRSLAAQRAKSIFDAGQVFADEGEVGGQKRRRIADFVGYSGGKLANRCQAIGFDQSGAQGFGAPAFDGVANGAKQRARARSFDQIVLSAMAQSAQCRFFRLLRGEDDDGRHRGGLGKSVDGVEARRIGQAQVGENDVGRLRGDGCKSVGEPGKMANGEIVVGQGAGRQLGFGRVIFHQVNEGAHAIPLPMKLERAASLLLAAVYQVDESPGPTGDGWSGPCRFQGQRPAIARAKLPRGKGDGDQVLAEVSSESSPCPDSPPSSRCLGPGSPESLSSSRVSATAMAFLARVTVASLVFMR